MLGLICISSNIGNCSYRFICQPNFLSYEMLVYTLPFPMILFVFLFDLWKFLICLGHLSGYSNTVEMSSPSS